MTAPLTEDELAAIEERMLAATPMNEWHVSAGFRYDPYGPDLSFMSGPEYPGYYDPPGVYNVPEQALREVEFVRNAPDDIARLLQALRAERAEVARLRKQLDALPVFSVMSDTPPRKDRGPFCAHLHRSKDNQCFDCGWQVPE